MLPPSVIPASRARKKKEVRTGCHPGSSSARFPPSGTFSFCTALGIVHGLDDPFDQDDLDDVNVDCLLCSTAASSHHVFRANFGLTPALSVASFFDDDDDDGGGGGADKKQVDGGEEKDKEADTKPAEATPQEAQKNKQKDGGMVSLEVG